MGRWIRVDCDLRDHPKVARIASALGVEPWGATGILVSLWSWAGAHASDGELGDASDLEIATVCRWRGDATALVDALVAHDALTGERGKSLTVVGWQQRQPAATATERSRKARRSKAAAKCNDTSVAHATDAALHMQRNATRPETRRDETRRNIYPTNHDQEPTQVTIDPTSETPKTADPPPVGVIVATLKDLERWGHASYGMLGGAQAAKLKRLLPLTRDELDFAARTKGRSWAYLASVLESSRREAAEPAPPPKPKAPPPHPLAEPMRGVAARVGLAEPDRRWLDEIEARGIPLDRVEAIAARVHAPHWGIVLDAIALDDRGESWAHLAL